MSTKPTTSVDDIRAMIKASGLEEHFSTQAGISSSDPLTLAQSSATEPAVAPIVMKPTISAATVPAKEQPKETADAKTGFSPATASDMLKPYAGLRINYLARKSTSTYLPSSLMMDYILHQVNNLLVDNFYFRRNCPDYHPYILRLYYGVLFWIQTARAAARARVGTIDEDAFLMFFFDSFPVESLPVSAPLLDLFKTLCCSQPEIPTYGFVSPILPNPVGPARRDTFTRNSISSFSMPNIPGIFALISDLNSKINPDDADQAIYPAKGKHIPVSAAATAATVFGHHSFPVLANRTAQDSWSLCSSGLQYPCEADKKLHEAYAERLSSFNFPTTAATDDLSDLASFLHMVGPREWFAQVRDVAAAEAAAFSGSGTLADCPTIGVKANQVTVRYIAPVTLPAQPTKSADPTSLFPFNIRLRSSARTLPEMAEAMAALGQTNVELFATHPYIGNLGRTSKTGPFWNIRPEEDSVSDDSSYLSVREIIRGLMTIKK